jgi:hypothetical protein
VQRIRGERLIEDVVDIRSTGKWRRTPVARELTAAGAGDGVDGETMAVKAHAMARNRSLLKGPT